MRKKILLDTGLLVAIINRRDRFHHWVTRELSDITYPLLTCEAVITEACFLLRNIYGGKEAVISLVKRKNIQIPFCLSEEVATIEELLKRYQSVPMSLADACLVRMSEQYADSGGLLRLDSDFIIYRKNRNQMINLIIPKNL